MSLIGEALKRARLEAARRDAEEHGAVYSEAPAYQPQRRGLARWPAAGILLGGLALGAVVGSGIFLVLRQAPPERRPAEPSVPPVAAPASASVAPAAPPSQPTAATAPNQQPPAPAPGSAVPIPAEAPRPSSAEKLPLETTRAARVEPRRGTPPLVSGRSYLRMVELPSGGRLELDGIVASADSPLTMINRQLLAPGESVEGFTVERIEPNQVTLRRDGTVVVLRLRDLPAG